MSLPNPIFLYPVRFSASSYTLRVTVAGATENLTFACTAHADYYPSGDGTSSDLLKLLDTCLDSHSGAAFSVSLTPNFQIGFYNGSSAFSILWTHANTTLSPLPFGFEASDVSSSWISVTNGLNAPNLPQGMWRPKRPASEDSLLRQPYLAHVGTSLSGVQRTARLLTPKRKRDISFALLKRELALNEFAASGEPYNTFEKMTDDALSIGRTIRLYPDETDLTSDAYMGFVQRELTNEPADLLTRDGNYAYRWQVILKLREV